MAVATPRNPATPTRSLPVVGKKTGEAEAEWWVEPIKWVALAVFIAIPIFAEPPGLRETKNSQCTKCTACKKSCPDINEENGYWKEIGLRPKRFVYFAFPGLVFGFYFYYYLQAGTWDYYFNGEWTKQAMIIHWAFLPGHDAETAGFFFAPALPRAAAAILTLAVCALASYSLFSLLERPIG